MRQNFTTVFDRNDCKIKYSIHVTNESTSIAPAAALCIDVVLYQLSHPLWTCRIVLQYIVANTLR